MTDEELQYYMSHHPDAGMLDKTMGKVREGVSTMDRLTEMLPDGREALMRGLGHGFTGAISGPAQLAITARELPSPLSRQLVDLYENGNFNSDKIYKEISKTPDMIALKSFVKDSNKAANKDKKGHEYNYTVGSIAGYALPWAAISPVTSMRNLLGSTGLEGFTDYTGSNKLEDRLKNTATNAVLALGTAGLMKGGKASLEGIKASKGYDALANQIAAREGDLKTAILAKQVAMKTRVKPLVDALTEAENTLKQIIEDVNTPEHMKESLAGMLQRTRMDVTDEAKKAGKLFTENVTSILERYPSGNVPKSKQTEVAAAMLKNAGLIKPALINPRLSQNIKESAKRYPATSKDTHRQINLLADIMASSKDIIFPDD